MKKSKSLILSLCILGILIALLCFIKFKHSSAPGEAPATASPSSSVSVVTFTKDQIKDITVKGDGSSLTYLPTKEAWTLKDLGDIQIDDTSLNYSGNAMLAIQSDKAIESTDLKQYGLDVPSKTLIYSLKDGTVVKLFIGSNTMDGSKVYVKTSLADGSIYVIPDTTNSAFKSDLSKFRITKLDTVDASTISYLNMKGKDIPEFSVSMNEDSSAVLSPYTMSTPQFENMGVDADAYTNLLKALPEFTVEGFVADNVTDLSTYGLDQPSLTLTLETKTYPEKAASAASTAASDTSKEKVDPVVNKLCYKWGKETSDGMIYFTKEGSNSVYTMKSDFLDNLTAAADIYTLCDKFMCLTHINNVSSVDLTLFDKKYNFTISDSNPAVYKINNKTLSEDDFKTVYSALVSTKADNQAEGAEIPSSNPAVSVTFHLKDGSTKSAQLYDYDDQFYIGLLQNALPATFNIKQFKYLSQQLSKY